LSSIDPQRRPWDWHIKRTIIYCSVHFCRGIDSSDWKDTAYAAMAKEILVMEDKDVSIRKVFMKCLLNVY